MSKKKKHKRKRAVFSLKAVTLWPRRRLAESGELHRFVMMMGKTNESRKWKSSTFLLFHHLPYLLGVSLLVFFPCFSSFGENGPILATLFVSLLMLRIELSTGMRRSTHTHTHRWLSPFCSLLRFTDIFLPFFFSYLVFFVFLVPSRLWWCPLRRLRGRRNQLTVTLNERSCDVELFSSQSGHFVVRERRTRQHHSVRFIYLKS